jgi:hypothetical protein
MSDNNCGFTKDQFLAVLHRFGPELSAHEIAHLGKVSLRQVLCAFHHADWDIQAVAGEKGWLYRKRPVTSAAVRMPKERGIYNDQGITPGSGSPKGYIS